MNTKSTMCRLVMKGSVVVRTHNETLDFSLQCDSFLHTPSMYLEWVHLSKNSRIVPWQLTYVELYSRPNPWRTWFYEMFQYHPLLFKDYNYPQDRFCPQFSRKICLCYVIYQRAQDNSDYWVNQCSNEMHVATSLTNQ